MRRTMETRVEIRERNGFCDRFADIISEICDSAAGVLGSRQCSTDLRQPVDEHSLRTEENDISKVRKKLKAAFLGLGFACIVVCFIFAAMGYLKFRNCPLKDKTCGNNPEKFAEARNYRVAAALLFIVGICLIVAFVWIVKTEGQGRAFFRTDVVISGVTEEGLLKTPAPDLLRACSHSFSIFNEPVIKEKLFYSNTDDLPEYEYVINKNKSSVTPDGVIVILNGVQTESVGTQVDEDDIIPPPTYLQALEMVNEIQENVQENQPDSG